MGQSILYDEFYGMNESRHSGMRMKINKLGFKSIRSLLLFSTKGIASGSGIDSIKSAGTPQDDDRVTKFQVLVINRRL